MRMPIYNEDREIIGSYDPILEEREAEEARWEEAMNQDFDDMPTLYELLVGEHELSDKEAEEAIAEMRAAVADGEDPVDVLHEWGIEADWADELFS